MSRPLAELSPMGIRRNSPSWSQSIKHDDLDSTAQDLSPLTGKSPSSIRLFWQGRDPSSTAKRDSLQENRCSFDRSWQSPTPSKRSSLEKLRKASPVKNSNIFAREQKDGAAPVPARVPLSPDRPWTIRRLPAADSVDSVSNGDAVWEDDCGEKPAPISLESNEQGIMTQSTENKSPPRDARPLFPHRPDTSPTQPSLSNKTGMDPRKGKSAPMSQELDEHETTVESTNNESPTMDTLPLSPHRSNVSPTKSSLSKKTGIGFCNSDFDTGTDLKSDNKDPVEECKSAQESSPHHHAKSVTFDNGPPQVNEYEMATPVPSSIASGSREGSYESEDEDDDEDEEGEEGDEVEEEEEEFKFEPDSLSDREDSFDASLEDTEKTPIVLPEDWRFMSPELAKNALVREDDDPFDQQHKDSEPAALRDSGECRPRPTSLDSVDSDGQQRPLPPLPKKAVSEPSSPLAGTLERISISQRLLPSAPPQGASISKSDIRRMSGSCISLEDRLRLMMLQEHGKGKSTDGNGTKRISQTASRVELKEDDNRPSPGLEVANLDRASEIDEMYKVERRPTIGEDEIHISRTSILERLSSHHDLSRGYEDDVEQWDDEDGEDDEVNDEVDDVVDDVVDDEVDDDDQSVITSTSQNLPSYYYLSNVDPDVPIPTTEAEDEDVTLVPVVAQGADPDIDQVHIKREPADEEDGGELKHELFDIPLHTESSDTGSCVSRQSESDAELIAYPGARSQSQGLPADADLDADAVAVAITVADSLSTKRVHSHPDLLQEASRPQHNHHQAILSLDSEPDPGTEGQDEWTAGALDKDDQDQEKDREHEQEKRAREKQMALPLLPDFEAGLGLDSYFGV